ncbi:MAG: hypothetical protein V4568_06015 [Pseudomonadota bacterium]
MSSSIGKSFDYLNTAAELTSNIAAALQNHIAARTAIRDYIINGDEKRYGEVAQLNSQAIEILEEANLLVEKNGPLDAIHGFIASIREWGSLAQQVHDKFSGYQELIHAKVMTGFTALAQSVNTIFQINTSLTTAVVLDVQMANVAIVSYLLKGEDHLTEDAQRAIDSAREKIDQVMQSKIVIDPALQSLLTTLDAYEADFRTAVDSRKDAYNFFQEKLAPLGAKIHVDIENYQNKLIDIQEGINDLKILNDSRKKNKNPPIH